MSYCSTDTVKSIIESAVRAPSGDNVQPWNFEWNDNFITIGFRPALARHVLDAGSSASAIALGCLLESIRIAASVHGISARFEFLGLPEREAPCARIYLVNNSTQVDALASALPKRTTDRRLYQGGPMPVGDVKAIWTDFDEGRLVRVDCLASIGPELLEFILAAEALVATHSAIFPDTLPWIRFSRAEVVRTQDGMPWQGTGVGAFEFPALFLMRRFPSTFHLFRRAGMGAMQTARVKKLLQSSAGLICISTLQDGLPALLTIGRFSMRLWLRLCQSGYGVQPLTISSLLMYNAKQGMLDAETQRIFGQRYTEGERLFRREFAIPGDAQPVWLLRTGISTPLPDAWVTPRRDVRLNPPSS